MIQDFFQTRQLNPDLATLLLTLLGAIERISATIIHESTGKSGTKNAYGEEQIAMDVEADRIMNEALRGCSLVGAYSSEEQDGLQLTNPAGLYSVFHDPLDGSSLFDVNFSVGTIVGIYKGLDVLGRTPREQLAAFYALYGPKTTLMLSFGEGVHEFLLTERGWELVDDKIEMREGKAYFAPGNLRATAERQDYFELVSWYIKSKYTLRYSGGMVPDLNHVLKKGSGIFMYPGMPSAPQGKLRLMYECGPMAFLVEQAGGASSNGRESVLDMKIESLTQKTPVFLGLSEEVERATKALGHP